MMFLILKLNQNSIVYNTLNQMLGAHCSDHLTIIEGESLAVNIESYIPEDSTTVAMTTLYDYHQLSNGSSTSDESRKCNMSVMYTNTCINCLNGTELSFDPAEGKFILFKFSINAIKVKVPGK